MRLFLSCTELGLGHVTRLIPLGKKLAEKGHELFFFSGGTAYQLLEKEFENVNPCTPVAWYQTAHGVSTAASLLNILIPLPYLNIERSKLQIKNPSAAETVHRYYDLRRLILRIRPDLIISDGDIHALRMAHRWRIPSVYVTNIIRPSLGFSPLLTPGERFTERYVKRCARIIVPDNPPPYTICEYNLGDLNDMQIQDKVEFVGSFLDLTPAKGAGTHIFCPISGPLGTRAKLKRTIVPVLETLETRSVVSLGEPDKKITSKSGNCEVHSWLSQEERRKHIRNSRIVVFSGGHTTCFETIKYAKPSVCVPTQPEQLGNGRKLQELNCSTTAKNSKQLKLAIQKIEKKRDFYKKNAEALNEQSSKFSGLNHAVHVIENI